jgi:hypothetical protein
MALKESKCRFNLSIEKEQLNLLKQLAEADDSRSTNSMIIKLINIGLRSENMQELLDKVQSTDK